MLESGSDHLPVYADFYFAGSGAVDQEENASGITVSVSPLPIHDRATFMITNERRSHIQLTIADLTGKELAQVVDSDLEAGEHTFEWDAAGVPAGTYVYTVESNGKQRHGKVTIIR